LIKALELNPLLASAYSAQGWISMHYDWNWDAAEQSLLRAIDLSPADPETHHSYSHYLLATGRHRESFAESQRAIDLDPLNAGMRGHLVLHFDLAHDFVSAIDAAKTAVDIDPTAPGDFAITAYESSNRFDEAIDARAELAHPPELLAALRTGLATAGAQGYWSALRDSELDKSARSSDYTLAHAYARLGKRREAMELLEKAFSSREPWLVYLNVNPHFDGLRGDPRFEDLVTRIGLPGR
jgi:tetratricopeptide (TPR) repeat protein